MRVYQKLLLGLALVALLVGCVGYVAQRMNRQVEYGVLRLSEDAAQELHHATEMTLALRESRAAARALVATADTAAVAGLAADLAADLARFDAHLAGARAVAVRTRTRAEAWGRPADVVAADGRLAELDGLSRGFGVYRRQADRLAERAADQPAARLFLARSVEPQVEKALLPVLGRYRAAAHRAVEAEAAAVHGHLRRADQFLFVSVLLAIGLTLVLGVLIAHSIAGPLSALTDATRRIGRGRWDLRLKVRSSDEVGDLTGAFNAMAEELGRTTVTKGYLDNILHSMADPLIVVDAAGRIELVNRAVCDALGYAPEALLEQPLGTLFAEGHPEADALLAEVEKWGFTGNRETAFRTSELAELPVAFSAALMRGAEGEVQGIVCVAKDVTERKLYEAGLIRAKEEAEAMSRMKSNFLANMSHEIRTPLTGIIGSAQVLTGDLEGEHLEMVEVIERAGVRLLGTINSVLDMARIEAGELHPNAEPLALAAEVEDAVSVLGRLAEGKGLSLTVAEQAPAVWVSADPGFLHRILNNLIGNAIKFTHAGGVTVEIDAEGRDAVLRVRDTGIGISEGFLAHLFDEFKQESTGFQRSHEGTGLGLAITKRLVELTGGRIEVASQKGAGSTFTVRLRRLTMPEGLRTSVEDDRERAA